MTRRNDFLFWLLYRDPGGDDWCRPRRWNLLLLGPYFSRRRRFARWLGYRATGPNSAIPRGWLLALKGR